MNSALLLVITRRKQAGARRESFQISFRHALQWTISITALRYQKNVGWGRRETLLSSTIAPFASGVSMNAAGEAVAFWGPNHSPAVKDAYAALLR